MNRNIKDYLSQKILGDDLEIGDMYELISELENNNCDMDKISNKTLPYLLILLKNRNVSFDSDYVSLILNINTILSCLEYNLDDGIFEFNLDPNVKVEINDYCEMFTFLALDYSKLSDLEDENDIFLLNVLSNRVFQELIFLLIYPENDKFINELKKYNNIVYNILYHNKNYITDYINRKQAFYKDFYDKHNYIDNVEDSLLNYEQSFLILTIEIFISNLRTFNYNYSLISESMLQIRKYIEDNYTYITQNSFCVDDIKDYILYTLSSLSESKKNVLRH